MFPPSIDIVSHYELLSTFVYVVACTDAYIRGAHLFPLDFLRIQYIVSPVPYSLALRPLLERQYIYLVFPCPRHCITLRISNSFL